jgi:prepilin-type N-terminal cleavage/methylation domain-containing protein
MELLSTSISSQVGFTLAEVLVSLALLGVLALGIGPAVFGLYTSYLLASSRTELVATLRNSRSMAVFGGVPSGVHFSETGYSQFVGSTFIEPKDTTHRHVLPAQVRLHVTASDLLFAPFSGEASENQIVLSLYAREVRVMVTGSGGIYQF